MSDTALHGPVCPACPVGEMPRSGDVDTSGPLKRFQFSVPTVHCAACMTTIEAGLADRADVDAARVNLTLRRVTVTAHDHPEIEDRLIAALDRLGFEAHALDAGAMEAIQTDAVGRDLLARLGVAGFAAMNVMLLSVSVWSGATDATRDLLHWVSAAIALPTVAFSGLPFFRNAWSALRVGRLNMDVPISLALILACGVSLAETMESGAHAYFDAALTLCFFLLIGRYLDHRTRAAARTAAGELAALDVQKVTRLDAEGHQSVVSVDAVAAGDRLLVPVGQRVPVDGTVLEGHSDLDPSLLTGETVPVSVGPDMAARAGMLNLSGPLTLRADAVGEDTLLKQIARLVEQAETTRNHYTSLADRAAKVYAPLVHGLAAVAFLFWGVKTGDWRLATNIAAAVLIITCPCALGLAVPAVLASASGRLFRSGVLLKDGVALEKLARADVAIFDKTGTLTRGTPTVDAQATTLDDRDWAVAAGLGQGSAHPLAAAIRDSASALGIRPAQLEKVREWPGFGTEALWQGRRVRLGRADWVGADGTGRQSQTASWLGIEGEEPRRIAFRDEMRPEAPETVAALTRAGVDVRLLSGDVAPAVADLADRSGIAQWEAGMTPEEKVRHITGLKEAGHTVLMVGDGLNDTAALAAADVSMSPASAVDATRSSADMIITSNDLSRVASTRALAVAARRRILENFSIAAVYNMIAVPLALSGIATPLMAAIAMSTSSILVSVNALRLGRRT
ncbi:heavy metal translocating P-type ATPase [Oceanomicrobium pacificus]|uniref:Cadmium-translocating P-type ATPase n=1 Tax=Oceanomicrobium pacificus TaxID=2692916 RepID=A0A6B0TM04_9RHOB|nr:heavy metal translocating P-type ATPase [Oceanomicrobium pacificus]MXU65577.1 cadmium-translocating P-type ATPase [Oceanomicrobium pacificus]